MGLIEVEIWIFGYIYIYIYINIYIYIYIYASIYLDLYVNYCIHIFIYIYIYIYVYDHVHKNLYVYWYIQLDSPSLKAYSSWKNSKQPIVVIKFSPNGQLLASGSKDGNIYVYVMNDDKKTFRRQALCRGHPGAITHLDFSTNSQYIQSNCTDFALIYWDIQGMHEAICIYIHVIIYTSA
jgi:hypothetical protein